MLASTDNPLAQIPQKSSFNCDTRTEGKEQTPLRFSVDVVVGLLELQALMAHIVQHVDARAAADVPVVSQYLSRCLQLLRSQVKLLLHSVQYCRTTWKTLQTKQSSVKNHTDNVVSSQNARKERVSHVNCRPGWTAQKISLYFNPPALFRMGSQKP